MKVALREWVPEDAEALVPLANDRRIWLNLRDAFPHPYGIDDAHQFIAMARDMSPRTYFAIVVDGELAGGIGYVPGNDVERVGAEVGYWLGVRFWGRGIATEAVRQLTRLAFERQPELQRLFALPYATNAPSARVLEKAGYTLEGTLRRNCIKDGVLQDSLMYSILRDEVRG